MRLTLFVISASLMAAPVLAQTVQPAPAAALPKKDLRLPIAVVDLRGTFARLGQDPTSAAGLSSTTLDLPASGMGIAGGAQVYVWRGQSTAFGVGGEGIFARASNDLLDSTGMATGTTIDRRLRSASVNLSLNFGHRAGWSYITVGIGPTSFETYLAATVPDGLRESSLNYGGGARWFNWKHLAFTADMRFYQTKPALATPNTAPRARNNVVVFSGGIAIK